MLATILKCIIELHNKKKKGYEQSFQEMRERGWTIWRDEDGWQEIGEGANAGVWMRYFFEKDGVLVGHASFEAHDGILSDLRVKYSKEYLDKIKEQYGD